MWIRVLGVVLVGLAGSFGAATGQSGNPGEGTWRSARYCGGTDSESAERLPVAADGQAYLLGRTFSSDMDAAVVPVASASGEPASATFVLKLGRDGQQVYALPVGTGFSFLPLDIAVGLDRAAHVLARDGDVTHVVKVAANGTKRLYDVTFSAVGREALRPTAIGVDDVGHAVIAGAASAGLFIARLDTRGAVFDMHVFPFEADVR